MTFLPCPRILQEEVEGKSTTYISITKIELKRRTQNIPIIYPLTSYLITYSSQQKKKVFPASTKHSKQTTGPPPCPCLLLPHHPDPDQSLAPMNKNPSPGRKQKLAWAALLLWAARSLCSDSRVTGKMRTKVKMKTERRMKAKLSERKQKSPPRKKLKLTIWKP